MAKTSELEGPYRATTYRVFLPDTTCELRIDQANEILRNWLRGAGATSFALVTACNPRFTTIVGRRKCQTPGAIGRRFAREDGYQAYAAENVADAGDWPVEESCFVPGLAPEDARALGKDYGQNAVLVGAADGIPRFLWIAEHE